MKKRLISSIVIIMLMLFVVAPALAADNEITVSVSDASVTTGDTIDVTVSFARLSAANISVLELILPIDDTAFEYVEGSVEKIIENAANTTGAAAFRPKSSDIFCNWVDVTSALPTNTSAIFKFKLTVTEYAKNGEYTLALNDEGFLTDANDNDIVFDKTAAVITISGSPEKEPPAKTADVADPGAQASASPNVVQDLNGVDDNKDGKSSLGTIITIIVGVVVIGCLIALVALKVSSAKKNKNDE